MTAFSLHWSILISSKEAPNSVTMMQPTYNPMSFITELLKQQTRVQYSQSKGSFFEESSTTKGHFRLHGQCTERAQWEPSQFQPRERAPFIISYSKRAGTERNLRTSVRCSSSRRVLRKLRVLEGNSTRTKVRHTESNPRLETRWVQVEASKQNATITKSEVLQETETNRSVTRSSVLLILERVGTSVLRTQTASAFCCSTIVKVSGLSKVCASVACMLYHNR